MIEEILRKFPMVIDDTDLEDKNIMQLAAEHRQPEIYDLVRHGIDKKSKFSLFGKVDAEGNSVLHLAAKYPQGQPILIPGAATQMHYEYKWFQFVKETMPPHFSNRLNRKGQTAMEVFITTHKELAMERAKWLRNAMQSFSVVAALITTVAFATISTVPGGLLQDKGSPVFQGSDNFNTFSLSSFFAFFFSAMSLLMFICAIVFPKDLDFANKRPMHLTWGANFLFISIVAMFISFFYGDMFVLDKKIKYLAYPTFVLTFCVAITNSPFSLTHVFPILPDKILKRAYPNNIYL